MESLNVGTSTVISQLYRCHITIRQIYKQQAMIPIISNV